jgi:hypothetical protein
MKRLSLELPLVFDIDFDHRGSIAALRNAVNAAIAGNVFSSSYRRRPHQPW